ncbi:MAG TPA: histidine phosphatase family protein, partial [Acidimicrobiales bacterium]|nr:histidine phosphatase family protein [Acidimicrobiales bacterium]
MTAPGDAGAGWAMFLIRHGRTELNAAGALRGRMDVALDEVGEEEARRLGALFAASGVALVISSPLRRARATAAAVAEAAGLSVLEDQALADRDYGPWNGAAEAEVVERFGSVEAAPGVEAWSDFAARVLGPVEAAATRAGGRPVALVAHEAVNRAILVGLVPALGAPGDLPQPTGCWNELALKGGS